MTGVQTCALPISERIVIGSVFKRAEELYRPIMEDVLKREALSVSLGVCKVVAAELDENLGDFAAIAVAESVINKN